MKQTCVNNPPKTITPEKQQELLMLVGQHLALNCAKYNPKPPPGKTAAQVLQEKEEAKTRVRKVQFQDLIKVKQEILAATQHTPTLLTFTQPDEYCDKDGMFHPDYPTIVTIPANQPTICIHSQTRQCKATCQEAVLCQSAHV